MGVFAHWPNRITAIRFVGALVLFANMRLFSDRTPENIHESRSLVLIAFWLFVFVASTDFLDGYLARKGNLVSVFGRIADPFVDKVLILGTMIFLAVAPWSRPWMPAWMVVVILAREFLVTGLRGFIESEGGAFPADGFGKIKMIAQCLAVGSILWMQAYSWPAAWLEFWASLAHGLVWVTLLATLGSGISYVMKTRLTLSEAKS
ncbi:MAG: CDP-diacylglycerol--glycerol-3-phosphate 3-phosphatidyltransferase [Planctomycetota bacterium]|jgi:CDP-diacylglycerol--glycerol-3-phosphate 3-phosphatidyltransferase